MADKITAACRAMRKAGIAIEWGGGTLLEPAAPEYDALCKKVWAIALKWQQVALQSKHPQVPTPTVIRQVSRFAKTHGLQVRMLTPEISVGGGTPMLGVPGKIIILHAANPLTGSASEIEWKLGHEYGHVRDRALFPQWKALLDQGVSSPQQILQIFHAHGQLLKAHLPPADQKAFEERTRAVFGTLTPNNPEAIKQAMMVAMEVVRYGEEVQDPKSRHLPSAEYPFRKGTGRLPYLFRLVNVARYAEMGLWEKLQQKKDFDRTLINDFKPEDLAFMRALIRAATHLPPR